MHKSGLNEADIFNIMFREGANKNLMDLMNLMNANRSETPGPSPPKLFRHDLEHHQQERAASVIQEVPPALSPAPTILKPIPLMGTYSALLADLFTPTIAEVMELYRRLPFFAPLPIINPELRTLLAEIIRPQMDEWVNEFARARLFSIMPNLRNLDESIISSIVDALKRYDGSNVPGFPSPIETSLPFPLLQSLPPDFNIHQQILLSTVTNLKMTQSMLPNPLELLSKMGPKDILSPCIVSESGPSPCFANLQSVEPVFKVPRLRKIASPRRHKETVAAQ